MPLTTRVYARDLKINDKIDFAGFPFIVSKTDLTGTFMILEFKSSTWTKDVAEMIIDCHEDTMFVLRNNYE